MLTLNIREKTGICRWCGCTYLTPCDGGCAWANRTATLCSLCVEFDRLIKTRAGRAKLVEVLSDSDHAG